MFRRTTILIALIAALAAAVAVPAGPRNKDDKRGDRDRAGRVVARPLARGSRGRACARTSAASASNLKCASSSMVQPCGGEIKRVKLGHPASAGGEWACSWPTASGAGWSSCASARSMPRPLSSGAGGGLRDREGAAGERLPEQTAALRACPACRGRQPARTQRHASVTNCGIGARRAMDVVAARGLGRRVGGRPRVMRMRQVGLRQLGPDIPSEGRQASVSRRWAGPRTVTPNAEGVVPWMTASAAARPRSGFA